MNDRYAKLMEAYAAIETRDYAKLAEDYNALAIKLYDDRERALERRNARFEVFDASDDYFADPYDFDDEEYDNEDAEDWDCEEYDN